MFFWVSSSVFRALSSLSPAAHIFLITKQGKYCWEFSEWRPPWSWYSWRCSPRCLSSCWTGLRCWTPRTGTWGSRHPGRGAVWTLSAARRLSLDVGSAENEVPQWLGCGRCFELVLWAPHHCAVSLNHRISIVRCTFCRLDKKSVSTVKISVGRLLN